MNSTTILDKALEDHYKAFKGLETTETYKEFDAISSIVSSCLSKGGKILLCGNGGSAADAQHIAAELSGRFKRERRSLPAEALHCNTSYLTAVANDYGYDQVYSRILQGIGNPGDILLALTTSGNSINIIKALEEAEKLGMTTIVFTGKTGGKIAELKLYNHMINVDSTDTARIQECHIFLGHALCEVIDEVLWQSTH